MLSKDKNKIEQLMFFSMEDFLQKYHLSGKIESTVDFSYLYSIAGNLYCHYNNGPRIDPVLLF